MTPPLRVLFLTPYFRPYLGGVERAIEQLTFQIQQSAEVEAVAVLTTKYAFPRVPQPHWADRETTPEGIEILRLSGFPKWSVPLYSVPLVWFSPLQVRRYLREFRPNVVHFVSDGWFWGHFWSWFWLRGRARFVFTPSYHRLPLIRWWLRPINAFLCRVVDRIVSLTNQEAGLVRRDYWAPPRKQVVIGWGAPEPGVAGAGPCDNSSPDPETELGSPDESTSPLTLLCVGRLGRHKGQEWLLEVYRQARSRFQRPARLVLVGRDEDAQDRIAAWVQEAGLEREIIMFGEASDQELARWYSQADLFVLFSRYEAFGLVFFEAMAHATPVLTHDVGANRELLTQGAVVTPPFDQDEAVSAMVRLVNDDAYRHELGRQAQSYTLSNFTWPAVAQKYLDVYRGT